LTTSGEKSVLPSMSPRATWGDDCRAVDDVRDRQHGHGVGALSGGWS
jgi:hypothetical protein